MSSTPATVPPVPTMSTSERIGFELSTALDKTPPVVRGWNAGNHPAVKAKIEAFNAREQDRVVNAALQLLD